MSNTMKTVLLVLSACGLPAEATDFNQLHQRILRLGGLQSPPATMDAAGFASTDNLRAIYFDALPAKGQATKVFAWLGLPKDHNGKVPGVVLVHGGGGSAFKEWVTRWTDQGFAAISIAVEGQTDERLPAEHGEKRGAWKKHAWAGPQRNGIYGDSDRPIEDQWMYHAVADTVLANSLLRSRPEVDADRVGLMGISWGGIITSTVIGIDSRFAFAIPVYGCGHLSDVPNQYGRALGANNLYKQVWDPICRLERATMPVLWLSWPGDLHFPLDRLAASYTAAPGARMVSLVPRMRHGHGPAWTRPESYAFARSIVETGQPWCGQTKHSVKNGVYQASFRANEKRSFQSATLVFTTDHGMTGNRKWVETPARLDEREDATWTATAQLPTGATAWFVNLASGDLVVSSDYNEAASVEAPPNPERSP